jgi:hypothetical protein
MAKLIIIGTDKSVYGINPESPGNKSKILIGDTIILMWIVAITAAHKCARQCCCTLEICDNVVMVLTMPNDQELSHAACDIRQPETHSAN